jgi:hypothetical protein
LLNLGLESFVIQAIKSAIKQSSLFYQGFYSKYLVTVSSKNYIFLNPFFFLNPFPEIYAKWGGAGKLMQRVYSYV